MDEDPFAQGSGAGLRRVKQALALNSEGVPITELMAGYGVAECTMEAADVIGLPLRGATVALQGFGNVGGAAARYLDRAGARITVIADIEGAILDPSGLDVPRLLAIRDRFGHIDRVSDRDPDVRRVERRGVIDPVTDVPDHVALAFQGSNHPILLTRRDARESKLLSPGRWRDRRRPPR